MIARTMRHDDAIARMPTRTSPTWWVADLPGIDEQLSIVRPGSAETLATSPGGHPIRAVSYGESQLARRTANFNSASAARAPEAFAGHRRFAEPVVCLVGPVHGHEVEGLVGLANLVRVMETGRDIGGTPRPELAASARRCRLVIVPVGNPEGVARFTPHSVVDMEISDLRFWGQGTWADDTPCGYPDCKSRHPMVGDDVGFVGCYFNDHGVNPMHDEFFAPMGTEAPAILALVRAEAPDIAVLLHSYPKTPTFLRTGYVRPDHLRAASQLAEVYGRRLDAMGVPHGAFKHLDPEFEPTNPVMNLASAIHHTSGSLAVTFESPHGTADGCRVSWDVLLEIQLELYRTVFDFALAARGNRRGS